MPLDRILSFRCVNYTIQLGVTYKFDESALDLAGCVFDGDSKQYWRQYSSLRETPHYWIQDRSDRNFIIYDHNERIFWLYFPLCFPVLFQVIAETQIMKSFRKKKKERKKIIKMFKKPSIHAWDRLFKQLVYCHNSKKE